MTMQLYNQAHRDQGIYEDLQTIVRLGFDRFRRKQLKALPQVLGLSEAEPNRKVCNMIRLLIREQIGFLPTAEWREFAERLFGLTYDTAREPAAIREVLAGEGLEKPRKQSTVRSAGGPREIVIGMLTANIMEWLRHQNPDWQVRETPPNVW